MNIKSLTINALFIALVLIATMFINVRLPIAGNGGLIHLGNVPLFLAAILYGKNTGAIAGAFGMAMFDLISGWTAWAPFTFLIAGFMGYAIGFATEKIKGNPLIVNLFAILIALIIKVTGYYFAEVILFGNLLVPLGSIPGNVFQIILAAIVVVPIAEKLKIATRIQTSGGKQNV